MATDAIRVELRAPDRDAAERIGTLLEQAGMALATDGDATLVLLAARIDPGFSASHAQAGGRRVVVISPPAGPRAVRKALETGADGIVWETHLEDRLAATVAAVAAGQVVVPREAWRPSGEQELTTREKQVLALVVMGLSNGEIARKLYLTESTVKSHLASSFRKLGVRSRAEAARVITDPDGGLGTGILAITPTSSSGRRATRAG